MAQAHFDFDLPTPPREADSFESLGFEIGWEHAHYHLTPPVEHLLADHPVRQGWQAGAAAYGRRHLVARPQVKVWLKLRLEAWVRGRAFEAVQVTPHFLAQIEAASCPVTRTALKAIEASPIVRLNSAAGYAAGNLALLGERAERAKGEHGWLEALAFARRIEAGEAELIDGLDAAEWSRLAVLMSFATPLTHAQAAALPLRVLPPKRVRVLNPVQALQTMLTLQFTTTPTGRRIADLAALMPSAELRQSFQVFMHTLLARRVEAGLRGDTAAQRRVMEDAWTHPLVMRRWQSLALRLSETECQRIVEIAAKRGLAGSELRVLAHEAATDGWALESRGQLDVAAVSAGNGSAAHTPRHGPRPQPRPLPVTSGTTLRS